MVPNGYTSELPGPYWSNPPFYKFLTFGLSSAQSWPPESPNVKNGGLDQYGAERFGRLILLQSEKCGTERVKKMNFWKSKMAAATNLKTVKSRYRRKRLTDFDEVWHGAAHWRFLRHRTFRIANSQNPRWRAADILKNRKMVIFQQRIDRSLWNLTGWRRFGLSGVSVVKKLKF